MINILITIGYFIAMVAAIVGIVMLLKKFIFSKIVINKYIPLTISIIFLLLQFFFKTQNIIVSSALTIIAVAFFAWFWDINSSGGNKIQKEKKIVIKSKPKPNRAKHRNK